MNEEKQYFKSLDGYYVKDEDARNDIAGLRTLISTIPRFSIQVVQTLPSEDISTTTVYLVPSTDPDTNNLYTEYIYVNNTWESLGTTSVDLSSYYTKSETNTLVNSKQDIIQYSTIPTASASNVGKIVQYVGATDSTYTNGYFYICTTDGTNYSWVNLEVQPNTGGEDIVITDTQVDSNTLAKINEAYQKFLNNESYSLKYKRVWQSGFDSYIVVPLYFKQMTISGNVSLQARSAFYETDVSASLVTQYHTYYINFTVSNGRITAINSISVDKIGIPNNLNNGFLLSSRNTNEYTPTANSYNPATTKYVDDAIASAITDALGGSY